MVEQSYAGECHCDAVLVAGHDDVVVANAAAGLCDVLYATLVSPLHVVAEGKESVAAEAHLCVLCNPVALLFAAQRLGLLGEELLPFAFGKNVHIIVADIDVDGVVAVGATNAWDERQGHYLRMLP